MTEHPASEVLAQYAEGNGDAATDAHVSACAECRSMIDATRDLEALLLSYSPGSRNLCPPRPILATCPPALEAHVEACPLCQEDLGDLAALEAAPRPSLIVRMARVGIELLESALLERLPTAQPAMARGGTSGAVISLRRELGAGETLEIAIGPGREGVDVLVGLRLSTALAGSLGESARALRFRVELVHAGRLIEGREPTSDRATTETGAFEGVVLLDGLAPGDYEIVIHRASLAPVEVSLRVVSS
jgi:hypothetical protein